MNILLSSSMLAGAILGVAALFGSVQADGYIPLSILVVRASTLSHFVFGELFYLSRFSKWSAALKMQWLQLMGVGILLFAFMRQTEGHIAQLIYIYFVGHFWKDIDLDFNRPTGASLVFSWRYPKIWTGIIVLASYIVLCSGLIVDPTVILLARQVVWGASVFLIVFALIQYSRGVSQGGSFSILSAHFSVLAGILLFVFTWTTVFHPFNMIMRDFLTLTHFMCWYVFYFFRIKKDCSGDAQGYQGIWRWFKYSPVGLISLIIIVNGLSLLGAGWYAWSFSTKGPWYPFLHFVYDPEFRYLLGLWTVLHITWNWPAKEVRGVRVGF